MTKISQLPDATTPIADENYVPIVQDGVTRKALYGDIKSSSASSARWSVIPSENYEATPASTSLITATVTSGVSINVPIRVEQNGAYLYGWVQAVTADTSIRFYGPPLDTGQTIDSLEVGIPELFEWVELGIPGAFASVVTNDLLNRYTNSYFRWFTTPAYLVSVRMVMNTTVSAPKVQVLIESERVLTLPNSDGLVPTNKGAAVYSEAAGISAAKYKIERNEKVELECTVSSTNARDLTVSLLFVKE